MKQTFKCNLILLLLFCAVIKANAQCPVNTMYSDLVDWLQAKDHAIAVQVTIINSATKEGTHYYTAWGRGNVIFTGPRQVGVPKLNPCEIRTKQPFSLLYSDREKGYIANLVHPFSVSQFDKQVVSLDVVNNTIISESKTWNYTTIYKNVVRKGNILFADLNGSMIILNLRFIGS